MSSSLSTAGAQRQFAEWCAIVDGQGAISSDEDEGVSSSPPVEFPSPPAAAVVSRIMIGYEANLDFADRFFWR